MRYTSCGESAAKKFRSLPRLPPFYKKYSFIRLDIQLVDWPSTTPCQNVDIELTNGKVESEDTHCERLFQEYWQFVCSPFREITHSNSEDQT
nr:hypothetical protein [Vibrio splendidus]